MKIIKMANIGLILGILLFLGFSIVPVSAIDDTSWSTPAPVEDIMAWFKSTSQNIWTLPSGSSGTLPEQHLRMYHPKILRGSPRLHQIRQ